jgi:O-succinylbenzoic acid--CoA ligase
MAEGEIYVQGPNVTKGYWKRESMFHDGFLPTGDIGYLDDEGFLFVLDRRSDLIVSGGENVYPAEIEAVLLSHPSVLEVGAAGADDPKWGQVPLAYVVLKEHVSEAELLSYCRERLAKYKLPSRIYFRDSLPRNASSKLMRRMLADGGSHD